MELTAKTAERVKRLLNKADGDDEEEEKMLKEMDKRLKEFESGPLDKLAKRTYALTAAKV